MKRASLSSAWNAWIAPEYPGLNKNLMVGVLCGLLGPLGVGIYLRSVLDFALCAVVGGLVMLAVGEGGFGDCIPLMVGAAWVAGRITWDTKRWRDDQGSGGAGGAQMAGSAPEGEDVPMAPVPA